MADYNHNLNQLYFSKKSTDSGNTTLAVDQPCNRSLCDLHQIWNLILQSVLILVPCSFSLGKLIDIRVGQKQSRHIVIHKRMGLGQLEIGHFVGHLDHIPADPVGQGAHLGSPGGAIADKGDLIRIYLRQQPDGHRLLQIHVTANRRPE